MDVTSSTLTQDCGYEDYSTVRFLFPRVSFLGRFVAVRPSMGDYLKAGASKLNIEYFGPKEDRALEKDQKAERLRITERQYIHLAIIYLAQMTERNIKAAFLGSQDIYPFKPAGRKKGTGDST